ncbi:unnamed protein product [Polarella glacialis]|uniref:RING-type domain-containing protein n=1 Tax=Polarella glacialis TaxID=89957 RepID=A0A813D6K9_POLGL|nr:unnamed protein product [Polarella glacialis]
MTSQRKTASPQQVPLQGTLEEKAVRHLGDLIAEGQVKTYESVLRYIETTKEAQELHCPVCLEPWKNPVKSKCGHIFCEQCICVWKMRCKRLRIPIQCPCCRADIQTVQQPVQAKSSAKSMERVDSGWLRGRPKLQKFANVTQGLLWFFMACQMLLLILFVDQAWGGLFASGEMLTFKAHAFGDNKDARLYKVPPGLPPLGKLIGKHGPGSYAVLNRNVILFSKRKRNPFRFRDVCEYSTDVKVPCDFDFLGVYQEGTLLKIDNPNDLALWDVRTIATDGTMTGEVIASLPLEYVSVLKEDRKAISMEKLRGVPILHDMPLGKHLGTAKLLVKAYNQPSDQKGSKDQGDL